MRPNRLTLLCGLALVLAIVAVLVLRPGGDSTGPTLTATEIASLPDGELMRRIRLDLMARRLAGAPADPPPADRLPVASTVAFEDDLAGLGPAAAIEGHGGAEALASAYSTLGSPAVAECLRRRGPIIAVLRQAGLERLRAAWVRGHAEAFAADDR